MSYSLICITNLPDIISRYGPLRLYWEGCGLGEMVLQQLKLLWLGFRKNWQENTLKDIYQQGELTRITEELRNEEKQFGAKMFHIYSDYITAQKQLLQNKPMSMIQIND
jgi:chitinase